MDATEEQVQADIKRMADAIYREKVLRARGEDPVQKLMDGFELFAAGLEFTKADVIQQIGSSDETAVLNALRDRFERVRRTREAGYFKPLAAK